ncbi:hypothetical protein GCM10022287_22100 [Gryllotalpicola koreensis]|uniref:Uncharacterized protein n=1 Tax=Gryllotalpicola koreensis TaxID=993086 RepID=A0ABP8A250_9MICO
MCDRTANFALAPAAESFEEDLSIADVESIPCASPHDRYNPAHRVRRDGMTYLWHGGRDLTVTLDPQGVIG